MRLIKKYCTMKQDVYTKIAFAAAAVAIAFFVAKTIWVVSTSPDYKARSYPTLSTERDGLHHNVVPCHQHHIRTHCCRHVDYQNRGSIHYHKPECPACYPAPQIRVQNRQWTAPCCERVQAPRFNRTCYDATPIPQQTK